MENILNALKEPGLASSIFRMTLAMLCGGIIGLERGQKRRAAGFRTHMLVCMGAAMTMIISQYLWVETGMTTDLSRLGAQVINGIGFLGAGTIIVTGKQQIKGLTTAAGLWASACMGLAIGAGFYFGALIACVFIILSITVLGRLEQRLHASSVNMNVYVEFLEACDIGKIIELFRKMDIKVYDVEMIRMRSYEGLNPSATFYLRLPRRLDHSNVITALAEIDDITTVEEL